MNAPISIVIGTKGGTGATTICVDAAMALARNSSVAVVDADFAARRSVAVLTDMVRPLDVSRTSANMAIASKNKFTVVEMAASIDGAFTIAQKDVETVALNLIETCDAIVIDAPQPFAAAIRPFVVRAARFVLVVEPTLLGLTNARLVQIELERFGVPRTHEVMVLNGRVLRRDVSRSDIEEALGLKAIVELPIHGDKKYDRAIESLAAALLVNRPGESLLELKPSSSAPIGDRRGSRRRPEENSSNGESKNGTTQAAANVPSPQTRQRDKRDQLKSEINDELTKRLDFNDPTRAVDDAGKLAELRTQVGEVVSEIMGNRTDVGSAEDIAELRQEIIDEALGLGPLEDLLRDPSITEIMVNGPEPHLCRAERQNNENGEAFHQRTTASAHHRAHHRADRAAHRRVAADGRRSPFRRLARQRDHRSALARRRNADHPALSGAPHAGVRSHQDRRGYARIGRFLARRRRGPAQHRRQPAAPVPVRRPS